MAEILVTAIIARATGAAVAWPLRSSQSEATHAQIEAQLASSATAEWRAQRRARQRQLLTTACVHVRAQQRIDLGLITLAL
jgi:hypothetical protein